MKTGAIACMKTNKPQNSKAGRPSFQIDGKRLRQIRESRGFTQEQLMQLVQQHSGKDTRHTSSETLKTSYRRWEKTGHIHPKNAESLTQILGVTMAVLQGQAPAAAQSRLNAITARIQERLDTGHLPLQEMLDAEVATERHSIHISMDGSPPPEQDAATEHQKNLGIVAKNLTQRLEYAQLSQDPQELSTLADLLGYSQAELQQPVSENGYWMLLQDGACAQEPQICRDIHILLSKVRQTLDEQSTHAPADTRITLRKEGAWFRLQILNPRWKRVPEIQPHLSFVRCQPSETGLQWTQPTWQDEFLVDLFEDDLSRSFNYVRGRDGVEKGPRHLANLRLAIYQLPARQEYEDLGTDAKAQLVALTGGALEFSKVEGYFLEDYKRLLTEKKYGDAHDLFTANLCVGLMDVLKPLLADAPLKYWKFTHLFAQTEIFVQLDAPIWFMRHLYERNDFNFNLGCKYRIQLMEQLPGNRLRSVAWRIQSAQRLLEDIHKQLARELEKTEVGPSLPPYCALENS